MAQESASTTVSHEQTQFAVSAQTVPSKIVIIGTFDPLKTTLPVEEEIRVYSPEDVGAQSGFGFMAHRLAQAAFLGSKNAIPIYMIFQEEAGGAVQSTGSILFAGTATESGTIHLYIGDIHIPVTVTKGDTAAEIATAAVAAIAAQLSAVGVPVTAAVNGVTPEQVDFTAKSAGPYGDGIILDFNWGFGQALPAGITATVTDMSGGTGLPDISTALDAMGIGDNQNQGEYTDLIHGYGTDTTTLDAVSAYNGEGSDAVGNYAKTVARPLVSLKGDRQTGTAGLTAITAIGEARRALDRTSGIFPAPGSPNHPDEIGAYVQGLMSFNRNEKAYASTIDLQLPWIIPGRAADRWNDQKTNRDTALQNGISVSQVKGSVVVALDVVTFYHPTNIPYTSNSYLYMRSIGIIRNMLAAIKANFERPRWDDTVIVYDKTKTVGDDAVDVSDARAELIALAFEFERLKWIYQAAFTVDRLKEDGAVVLRVDVSGFDMTFPAILSGETRILDTTIQTDTSIAILQVAS